MGSQYVAVGNEPFLAAYNGTYNNLTLPAMKNILKALNEAGVGKDIKVSTPLNGDVYITPTYKPSDGIFRHDLADIMNGICEFLHKNDAGFIVNIYPFLNLYQNPGFPEPYAFFDNDDSNSMDDHGVKYRSVLDANIDTLVAALKVANFSDIPIIVGEVGWPTDGNIYATTKNAKKFYNGLLKRMATNEGTPLRPKQYPDVYMFSLLDEDLKSIDPGMFERHWGIFSFDGQPKFPMDLSGKGQNKSLVGGKNVKYMEKQWCVYNKDASNQKDLAVKVAWACNSTDCTTLVPGASCSGMGIDMNASVAFNMYYQMANQTKGACDFEGLAKIVKQDPSNGTCRFPIMIKTIQTTSNSNASAPKSSREISNKTKNRKHIKIPRHLTYCCMTNFQLKITRKCQSSFSKFSYSPKNSAAEYPYFVAQGLGVNWGVIASHPLDPKIVVNILKDNGIKKVKLFHAEHDILTALSGTDIEVMVGIPNHSLESLSEKYSVAQAWVKANITAYMGKKGVNFKIELDPFDKLDVFDLANSFNS
ncbi:hypothetical protein GOBAR_DD24329 [Gossypium barbadense]|nr:hypothetical protein GOBAR_DD24329 [Gossypium barbadense]